MEEKNKKPFDMEESEYQLALGTSIAVARKKKGLSQLALSLDAGIAKSYLADLERGKRNPSILTLRKIGKALGVDIRTLMPR